MQLDQLRKSIKEKVWKIQLITGILLIIGILTPFSYIATTTRFEIVWTIGLIFTTSAGFGSIMNSVLLTGTVSQLVLPAVGFIYVVIVFLIAFLYIIYGIQKKELTNKKGKILKVPMWRMGLILLVLTTGILITQGIFYHDSIFYFTSFTFEFFTLHVGSYIIIIVSVLLILAGGITTGFKELDS